MKKDWLKISFFPIESREELQELRSLMTPFMKNVCRCYETEEIEKEERKRICDGIINTASSYVNSELKKKLDHVILNSIDFLKLQLKDLENISLK